MAKPKCQCYWPQVGESAMYGAIQVTTVSNNYIYTWNTTCERVHVHVLCMYM